MARMPKRIRVSAPDAFSRHRPKPKSIISCGWRCSRESPCGSAAPPPRGAPILPPARVPAAGPGTDALKHAVGLAPADALRAWPVDDPRDLVLEGGAHRQGGADAAPAPPPPSAAPPRDPGR